MNDKKNLPLLVLPHELPRFICESIPSIAVISGYSQNLNLSPLVAGVTGGFIKLVRLNTRDQIRELSVSELKTLFLSMRAALAHAASKIVPIHEVEDIVQETYVKLCLVKNPERIKHPKSYLYQMAKNLARDHAKSSGNRLSERFEDVEDLLLTREDLVYREAVSSQEFRAFCEAVRYLPLQCRRAFVLKKVYGYSQKEIAKELEITESTVEKHVALGLRRCAEKMPLRTLARKLKTEK